MRSPVAIAAVLLLAACGGEGPSQGGGANADAGAPIPLELMPAQLRKAMCDKIYGCCSAAERMGIDEIGQDAQSCQAALNAETTFFLADITLSVTEGRVIYHADKMATCLAELNARSCDQIKMPPGDKSLAQLCDGVFEPKVPVGGACSDYWDCIGGWCAGDIGGLQDTCTAKAADGTVCDEGPECLSGICDDHNTCVPRPPGSGNLCTLGETSVGQHIGHQ
jgi:hypothetical protein